VRIDGNRVGPLDSGQEGAVPVGKESRPSPGRIHMKMAADLQGQIGHGLQRIDVAGFGRAGDADQRQRENVPVTKAPTLLSQELQIDAVVRVGLHLDQIVPAKAQNVGSLAEGVVPALGDEDGNAVSAAMFQRAGQPLPGNAAKSPVRREEAVARHPERRDVGDGASGAEGPQGMLAVVHPWRIEFVIASIDQVMEHGEYLPLHGGKGLGGLHLDHVLVEGGHEPRQGEHEVRERRCHVADKTGCGGMDRLGNKILFDELGVFGDVGRFFGDGEGGETRFDLFEVAFNGDDMSLQKTCYIAADRLIDGAEGRIGRFRHGEDPVKVFQIGAGCVTIFRH